MPSQVEVPPGVGAPPSWVGAHLSGGLLILGWGDLLPGWGRPSGGVVMGAATTAWTEGGGARG